MVFECPCGAIGRTRAVRNLEEWIQKHGGHPALELWPVRSESETLSMHGRVLRSDLMKLLAASGHDSVFTRPQVDAQAPACAAFWLPEKSLPDLLQLCKVLAAQGVIRGRRGPP